MNIEDRIARLERENRRLRFSIGMAFALTFVTLAVVALQSPVADAQTSRVITAEWFLIEKNGERYGSFGVNQDNNVVFEMKKRTRDGWPSIFGYVHSEGATLLVAGPLGGTAGVELGANQDGSGSATVRGPGTEKITIWTVP